MIWETKNTITRGPEIRIAFRVLFTSAGVIVHTAIQFNDQAVLRAGEINDVIPYLMLATEPESSQFPVTQQIPQEILGGGLILPELAGLFL